MAQGYIGNPQETDKRFITLRSADRSACFYRTGDLGWMDETGLLRFAGRLDHQVKISGYRVEPDEITQRLSLLSDVMDAFVCAAPKADGEGVELLADVILKPNSTTARLELKRHLESSLPPPLRPSAYIIIDRFPMTTNGKVDRKALVPATAEDRFEGMWQGPSALKFAHETELEEMILKFWEQALGQSDLTPFDNFFDLGGHSLLAFQIVGRIEEALGVHLPANIFYRAPSVRELAEEVARLSAQQKSGLMVKGRAHAFSPR